MDEQKKRNRLKQQVHASRECSQIGFDSGYGPAKYPEKEEGME